MADIITHPKEIDRLNRINILMRLIDEILEEGKPNPQTYEEWLAEKEKEKE